MLSDLIQAIIGVSVVIPPWVQTLALVIFSVFAIILIGVVYNAIKNWQHFNFYIENSFILGNKKGEGNE